MPIPLALALSSASSLTAPIAFDWLTIIITSISSAIISGTGGFFIARYAQDKSGLLPNQGEKTLKEVSLLLDQTQLQTQDLQERFLTTNASIKDSISQLDTQLDYIVENNQQTQIYQSALNNLTPIVDYSILSQNSLKLSEITMNIGDSHQILQKQQNEFSKIVEQLNIIGQQYQVDQSKTSDLISKLTHLLQKDNTFSAGYTQQQIEDNLTQCMSELQKEKEMNQELYATIEELLSENNRLQKILHPEEENQIQSTKGMRMFNSFGQMT